MICKNCGKNNLDIASFCEQCGQPITYIAPQINNPTSYAPPSPPVQQAPQPDYYNQPVAPSAPPVMVTPPMSNFAFNPMPTLTPSIGKGQIITVFILSIIFSSIPSIVLSSIALSFKGKYESAVKYNDVTSANSFASKIKIFIIISWIVLAITALLTILYIVFNILLYFGILSGAFTNTFSNGTFTNIMF